MATEEFTFPITDPTHSPIDSPPLWRLSPTASPTPSYAQPRKGRAYDIFAGNNITDNTNHFHIISPRKSFSYIETTLLKRLKMPGGNGQNGDQEEKMDMLWEDLNEEFSKNHRESRMIEFHSKEMVEFGCVPASFKLSKSSTTTNKGVRNVVKSSNKKPSVVVLMRVLRKLFLLQHSQQSKKKRPC